jgi:hypothetical protein
MCRASHCKLIISLHHKNDVFGSASWIWSSKRWVEGMEMSLLTVKFVGIESTRHSCRLGLKFDSEAYFHQPRACKLRGSVPFSFCCVFFRLCDICVYTVAIATCHVEAI